MQPIIESKLRVQGFKNKIINGNFDIWQRGTSLPSGTTGSKYLADRWMSASFGSSYSVIRRSFVLGQTDVPNEPTYFYEISVTSSVGPTNYCHLVQKIESVRTLAGKTAVLSFYAKADAPKLMSVEFYQHFGTGGSPSEGRVGIGVKKLSLTTSWQKFVVVADIPGLDGKTLGTNRDDCLAVAFWFDAGSNYNARTDTLGQQSGTFDIAQVQLEEGSVATDFEMRPIEEEIALCQRYYEKSYNLEVVHGSVTTLGMSGTLLNNAGHPLTKVFFMVHKRKAPTVTAYSPATGASGVWHNWAGGNDRTITIAHVGETGWIWQSPVPGTAEQSGGVHYTADAEL